MNQHCSQIRDLIDYYRSQGAPGDQQMLIALLREAQDADGGILSRSSIDEITASLPVKEAVVQALIRRIPALRCETVAHKLEICGTCKKGAALRSHIEETYSVAGGSVCEAFKFSYRFTGCMKNCKNGPSVRWDGVLYPCATIDLLEKLIHG